MTNMTTKVRFSSDALQELNSLLLSAGHQLVTRDSHPLEYEKCIERWSAGAVKPAAAVLVPESIEAVSITVRYATDNNIDLAVRGGGHSTAGSSSTDGGLLIDLGSSNLFKQVEVDNSQNHIIAGGGANWGHVDDTGFAAGLATVGGTVHDTGIGGLTLGGGYGWLSGKLGLTIDNLVSVKLVTANGEVLTVSNEQNPELFWAIRGAGQNFGVAVQFVYQGHPYGTGPTEKRIAGAEGGQAFAGTIVFPISSLSEVLRVLNKLFAPHGVMKGGTGVCGLALARAPGEQGPVIILLPIIWLNDEKSGRTAFKELLDIGSFMEDLKMMDYPGINRLFKFETGMRVSMKGCAYNLPIREDFANRLLKSFSEFTERCPDASNSVLYFDLLDMTKIATKASNRDMAFGNRGYHLNSAAQVFWRSEKNDKVCRQWARDIAEMFKAELQRDGEETANGVAGGASRKSDIDAVMMYGNLDQYDEKARDLFGANYPRLQKIKALYDPTNTFNKHFYIQPAA